MSERLPMPDWSRPGETWRVEDEPALIVGEGLCSHREGTPKHYIHCRRPAVAVGRHNEMLGLCAIHLRAAHIWIESGRVVSWALRP